MYILILHLKYKYFDEIKAGVKVEEYRELKPYWEKRLKDRWYRDIHLFRGYPAREDLGKRIILPYRGYTVRIVTHPHFGATPVKVYVIRLSPN